MKERRDYKMTDYRGSWPVMLTPFTDNGRVDFESLDRLVDWYEEGGSAGLFAVCQSSEMFYLSREERIDIAKRVKKRARIPVIAAVLGFDDEADQQEEWERMADTGADALVLLTNTLSGPEGGFPEFRENLDRALERLPDIDLGLYECPVPFKRVVEDDEMAYVAATERFRFIKDTCCDIDRIKRRLSILKGSSLGLYNAHSISLLESLQAGAAGFSGIMANFAPDLCAWLCRNWKRHPETAALVQNALAVCSQIEKQLYPANAKALLMEKGLLRSYYSRSCPYQDMKPVYLDEVHQLDSLLDHVRTCIQAEAHRQADAS